ncbi:MAG: ATP-binding protein [Cellvibrionaceae bacterium]
MRLRRQLLFVSLFILSLPWAGCQYIRQMEKALRDGQVKALAASAQAVAARMSSEASAIALPSHPAVYNARQQTYLHPLRNPAIVDGYDEEWRSLGIAAEKFSDSQHPEFTLHSYAGWYQDTIYLYFSVGDQILDHHNPQQAGVASGDHLVLRALTNAFDLKEYVFRAGGTGNIIARYLNDSGSIRQEHRIRGEWRETGTGYEVELQVPMRLATQGLDFYFHNSAGPWQVGSFNPIDYPAPWIQPSADLESILTRYADDTLRISVVNAHQWLLAQAGTLSSAPEDGNAEEDNPLLAWLYRLAIGNENFPSLTDARRNGRMNSSEIDAALRDETAIGWYQHGNQRVGRVARPIKTDNIIIGAVAVEQSTDSLLAETNAAFNQLFLYTLLATGFAGFGLLAYASWLSFRIRRLNRAADTAVGDDGKIKPDFLNSRAKDEIGDLTRGYGRLLSRLRDYTDYLRTLSSKLSHELRTPLAVMTSSLENLGHQKLDKDASQYVQRAREASQRLSTILNAMSSANRMEESIQQAQTEIFSLGDLLTELITAYRATYAGTQFELDIAPAESDYRFRGSPDLIVQMLDKLVDNAVDFCPPDGKITVALSPQKNRFVLSVSNTGPPLPQHMQGQLFDSLVSVRDTSDKTHLGLGLYIVRLIVDFHGGSVTPSNLPDGSGVRFTVDLPGRET